MPTTIPLLLKALARTLDRGGGPFEVLPIVAEIETMAPDPPVRVLKWDNPHKVADRKAAPYTGRTDADALGRVTAAFERSQSDFNAAGTLAISWRPPVGDGGALVLGWMGYDGAVTAADPGDRQRVIEALGDWAEAWPETADPGKPEAVAAKSAALFGCRANIDGLRLRERGTREWRLVPWAALGKSGENRTLLMAVAMGGGTFKRPERRKARNRPDGEDCEPRTSFESDAAVTRAAGNLRARVHRINAALRKSASIDDALTSEGGIVVKARFHTMTWEELPE